MKNCPSCGVKPRTAHIVGCNVARCVLCGWQDIAHDCNDDYPDRRMEIWTGQWPGTIEINERLAKDYNDLAMKHMRDELIWNGTRLIQS